MTSTFTVRGMKLRTRTQRRYVVVFVRPETVQRDYRGSLYTYEKTAVVEYRTDSFERARSYVARRGSGGDSAFRVVVDTTTGEEV